MYRKLLVAAALLVAATVPAAAQPEPPPEKAAAARELLAAMNSGEVFARTMQAMFTENDELPESMKQVVMDFMAEHFSWAELEPAYVRIYADLFTTEDMRALTAFYRSSIGQKLVASTPELTVRIQRLTSEKMEELLPELMEAAMSEALSGLDEEEAPPPKGQPRPRSKP